MIHETIGKGSGLEVHHLIEKRLANNLGIKEADIPSIVLTKDEHRKFTNAWRNEIGYYRTGEKTRNTQTATKEEIFESAKTIYQDYPEILNVIEKMMK